jgi:hypothetical protein
MNKKVKEQVLKIILPGNFSAEQILTPLAFIQT